MNIPRRQAVLCRAVHCESLERRVLLSLSAAAAVVDRHVFYNASFFDGSTGQTPDGPNDDAAVAPDKNPLLPGRTAAEANYTSYTKGINGVMVDISDLPAASLATSDFEFRVGNDNNPAGWALAPPPTSITVRDGFGVNGSDRVTIKWANGAINKTWLQVRVKNNLNTGLAAADVFYFGNAPGDTFNSSLGWSFFVNSLDMQRTRINQFGDASSLTNPASPFDHDKSGSTVNSIDLNLSRVNQFTDLKRITVPAGAAITAPGAVAGAADAGLTLQIDTVTLADPPAGDVFRDVEVFFRETAPAEDEQLFGYNIRLVLDNRGTGVAFVPPGSTPAAHPWVFAPVAGPVLTDFSSTAAVVQVAADATSGQNIDNDEGVLRIPVRIPQGTPVGTYPITVVRTDGATAFANPTGEEIVYAVEDGGIVVGTPPPPPGPPDLVAADDTGASNSDNITRINAGLSFQIAAGAGQFVRLFRDGVAVASGQQTAASIQLDDAGPVPDGTASYTATAADSPTGPQSPPSAALSVTVDTAGQLVPAGPEFRANTFTPNSQSQPAVASDGDGDFVVAWHSTAQEAGGGGSTGVYARLFAAGGTPRGGEIHVSTFVTGNQATAAVAMDADGDFVVVWTSGGQDGSALGVYGQRFNAAGAAQGVEFRVNTTSAGSQESPAVAMDASGNFVVAWHSPHVPANSFDVFAQRYNAAGVQQGGEVRVNTHTPNLQVFPSVAMDASGDYLVAWHSAGQDGSGNGVYAQRFDAAGAPQGGEFRVNSFTAGDQNGASAAMDASGDFVVAWQSRYQDGAGYGVYARRYDAAGAAQGGELLVNQTTADEQRLPSASMDAAGGFVVAWQSEVRFGPSHGVFARAFAADGSPRGGEFEANVFDNGQQRDAAVAMDADGDAVVAWGSGEQDGSGYGVYARRYITPIPGPRVNNNDGATGTTRFTQGDAVVVAFDGTVVVAFSDLGSSAGGADHFTGLSRSTDGGATFVDGGTIPTTPGADGGFSPSLARDEISGRIFLAINSANLSTTKVFRSDDGGSTWSEPIGATPALSHDYEPDLDVDNFVGTGRGNIYLVSQPAGGGGTGIHLHRSTNGGVTFSLGVPIVGGGSFSTGPGVVVGPDHAVYVFWRQGTQFKMRKSTDRGLTFGAEVVVASGLVADTGGGLGLTGIRQGTAAPAAFRTSITPQAAVNPVNGHLYVTYNNDAAGSDKADVLLVRSTDGGATWAAPVRVNDDATATDQWHPTLAVLPDGSRLGVFYYSRQEDPVNNNAYRYYGRLASTAGQDLTFAPSSPVSDVPSLPEFGRDGSANPVYMSLYNEAFATDGAFHAVWSDSRDDLPGGAPRKDPNIYYHAVPVTAAQVLSSSFLFDTAPHRLQFGFDQNVAASLGTDDVVLENLTNSTTIPSGELVVSYDVATNIAAVGYVGNAGGFNGVLPDGSYRATLIGSGITNLAGTPLSANHVFTFFFLNGDANRDARVNLADFNTLASNFGSGGRTFTQGNFNYDPAGLVNLADFNILAARFGSSLAAPAVFGRQLIGSTGSTDELGELLEELL